MSNNATFFLKLGIAFAFIYAGVSGLVTPLNWTGYFPESLRSVINSQTLILIWSIAEIALGIWIFSEHMLGLSSAIATVALIVVVLFNIPQMDILFRDISLAFAALALSIEAHNAEEHQQPHILIYERIVRRS